jgi:NMD protein affecting ribosome stability and mRNA decay
MLTMRCARCAGKLYPNEMNVCSACYARPHFQPIPAPPVIPVSVVTSRD